MAPQLICDPSARRHFTMVPNCVIDTEELSHAALRLYLWYKRICGETGECYQSLITISKRCRMNRGTVIKARRELAQSNLVRVEKEVNRDGSSKITVTVVNIWNRNEKQFKIGTGGVQNRDLAESKIGTLIRTPIKKNDMSTPCGADGDCSPSPSDGRKRRRANPPSKFDHRAVEELIKVVSSHVKVNQKHNIKEWANQIRLMREQDGVAKGEIRRTIGWYSVHIGEEYVPEAFSARTFRQKYKDGKFIAAMQRAGDAEASDGVDEDRLIGKVRRVLQGTGWDPDDQAFQEDVDKALVGMGLKPGRIDAACV